MRTVSLHRLTSYRCIVVWLILFVALAGCASEQVDQAIDIEKENAAVVDRATAKLQKELAQERDARNALAVALAEARAAEQDTTAIEAKLNAAAESVAKKETVEEELGKLKTAHAEALKLLEARRASLATPGDVVSAAGEVVLPMAPAAGSVLLLLGSLLKNVQQSLKNKAQSEALETMTLAIDSGQVPLSDDAAARLSAAQSPAAKAAVTKAQTRARERVKKVAPLLAPPVPLGQVFATPKPA